MTCKEQIIAEYCNGVSIWKLSKVYKISEYQLRLLLTAQGIVLRSNPVANPLDYYLTRYKHNAKRRFLEWELTKEDFVRLINLDCYYCGAEPSEMIVGRKKFICNGIDRIDSSRGYSLANVAPCCKYCNQMKMAMNDEEFVARCRRIVFRRMAERTTLINSQNVEMLRTAGVDVDRLPRYPYDNFVITYIKEC